MVGYAVIVYETERDFANRSSDQVRAAYRAYSRALVEAGVLLSGAELSPAGSGKILSCENSQRVIHDGPYAETKEQLGGFFIIDVPNLDEALAWAALCPATSSCMVEVRPLVSTNSSCECNLQA